MTYGAEQAPLDEHEWQFKRVALARLTGWRLDYIDSLSYQDVNDVQVVWGALDKREQRALASARSKGRRGKH